MENESLQVMECVRRELRRCLWRRRWVLTVLVAVALFGIVPAALRRAPLWQVLSPMASVGAPVVLLGAHWWPAERGWRLARRAPVASAVTVSTPVWGEPVTVTTASGEEWRWAAVPTRLLDPTLPARGDDAWVVGLGDKAYPVTLIHHAGRDRVCVARRPAYRVPERVT